MKNYREIPAKSILINIPNPPEQLFGGYYNFNLYKGCQHGCIYCDTRSVCYHNGELSDIRTKIDALKILDKELASKRRKGTVTTGSMNDPYMPVEKELEIVREALKLLKRHRFGVHVVTKSNLVVRDIDLLKEIAKIYAAVSISITTSDDVLSQVLEPHAASSSERFEALKELSKNGIYCGVALMPVLPFITDSAENIEAIIKRASECGAQYVICYPSVSLREGSREYYYKELEKSFPGVLEKYLQYGEVYNYNSPKHKELFNVIHDSCKKYGLATKMEFYFNDDYGVEQGKLF